MKWDHYRLLLHWLPLSKTPFKLPSNFEYIPAGCFDLLKSLDVSVLPCPPPSSSVSLELSLVGRLDLREVRHVKKLPELQLTVIAGNRL